MNLSDSVLTGDYAIVHDVVCQYLSTFAAHKFTFKVVCSARKSQKLCVEGVIG